MSRAVVFGASGGIGSAVVAELASRGWDVTEISRRKDNLDVTDEASVQAAIKALHGTYDLIFVATGALVIGGAEPEKAIRDVTAKALMGQYATNAIGPMLILKHALPYLARDRRAVFAALSARVGSIGDNRIGGWHSYRAAKAGLNQLIHGASVELGRTHKQAIAVCLHPGTVATAFTEKYAGRHKTVPAGEAAANLIDVVDGLTPDQTGGFFDYAGQEIPW